MTRKPDTSVTDGSYAIQITRGPIKSDLKTFQVAGDSKARVGLVFTLQTVLFKARGESQYQSKTAQIKLFKNRLEAVQNNSYKLVAEASIDLAQYLGVTEAPLDCAFDQLSFEALCKLSVQEELSSLTASAKKDGTLNRRRLNHAQTAETLAK